MKRYTDDLAITGQAILILETSLSIVRNFDPCVFVVSYATTSIDQRTMVDIRYGTPRQTLLQRGEAERYDMYSARIELRIDSTSTSEDPYSFREARLSVTEDFGPSIVNARFTFENGVWKPDREAKKTVADFYNKIGKLIPSWLFRKYMYLLDD